MTQNRRDKILGRVRALLNKADNTEFPSEREALIEKADNLMFQYAIEEAEIAETDPGSLKDKVSKKRIRVAGPNSPFREAIGDLLWDIVRHARCEVVFHGWGRSVKYPLRATMVGMEADLEYVEMLFTSLSLEISHALFPKFKVTKTLPENIYEMREAGMKWERVLHECAIADVDVSYRVAKRLYEEECRWRSEEPRRINPRTAKRNFVEGFRSTIRKRLYDIRLRQRKEADTSTALVPVRSAVKEKYEELFPRTITASRSQGGQFSSSSWARGKKAGDEADLRQPRMKSRKELP